MRAVTIREAKARLNALVQAAERGEQIIIMRGSKHVAAIVPLSEEDLEVSPRLTDPQAERLWRRLEAERQDGSTLVLEDADEVVAHLESSTRTARRSRTAKTQTSRRQR